MMAAVASETVQFTSDNAALSAFLVEPVHAVPAAFDGGSGRRPEPSRGAAPAVLVLHAWWGLTDHIKDVARRFADAGYVACAPDLYARIGGGVTADPAQAAALMSRLMSQWALRDLNAALRLLASHAAVDPLRLGVVGFSMGGTFALNQATHNSDLKAAVAFYGKVPPAESFDYLLCPVLFHYAAKDAWVTKAEVDLLRQARETSGKPIDVAVYPEADHGFFDAGRPQTYRPADAEAAWARTLQFLAVHLG